MNNAFRKSLAAAVSTLEAKVQFRRTRATSPHTLFTPLTVQAKPPCPRLSPGCFSSHSERGITLTWTAAAVNGSETGRVMITSGSQSALGPVPDCISDLRQNTVDLQDVQYLQIMTHFCLRRLLMAPSGSHQLMLGAVQRLQKLTAATSCPQNLRDLHLTILPSTGAVYSQGLFLPPLSVQLND